KRDPWLDIDQKYKSGDMVAGEVTKFNPFGAFIQIDSDIQGLCHISEFGSEAGMKEKLAIGNNYQFKIKTIDVKDHRMSLGLTEEA
ncbi:MAG: S1 RNA-binding domain-containing protein, partial [bacterium]|nr:S1 RNA-binding domain-containing protein [bacterium]